MHRINIKPIAAIDFDWAPAKRAQSVTNVYDEVLNKIFDSIAWYQAKRGGKRTAALGFRIGAIIFATIATLLPTLSEITSDKVLGWRLSPGFATIAGLIAAMLIFLDKLLGSSSGWIRYTMAETTLKELLDQLTSTFKLELGSWINSTEPTIEETRHTLSALFTILAANNQVVRDETNQWKLEFQGALQLTDDLAKAASKKVEEAIGMLKLSNPERLVGSWTLSINDGPDEPCEGDSKSFRLSPGSVTLRVKATVKTVNGAQRPYQSELADVLVAGAPKIMTITLPST